MPLLEARGVNVVYEPPGGTRVWSVRNVNLALDRGELVGLVGESGCGKSTLGYALVRLLRPPARLESGEIWFDGDEITRLEGEELRRKRRAGFAIVLQSGMNALNPVRTIEGHFADVMRAHARVAGEVVERRASELLELVHLESQTLHRFPHELSGGMRQRVAIALALALDPRLVVFDEPTTALDVIVQHAVIDTIQELQREIGFTALLISHDLGLVLDATDRVLVMYAGEIVEDQPAEQMRIEARHPYTRALLDCYDDPRADEIHLEGIPGTPPDLTRPIDYCPYAPRCPWRERICDEVDPPLDPLPDADDALVACHVAQRLAREGASAV
ncbi:MAG TPA: ABC transporter ATP-binding protein [Gaiellaceae bacterium]